LGAYVCDLGELHADARVMPDPPPFVIRDAARRDPTALWPAMAAPGRIASHVKAAQDKAAA